MGNFQRTLTGLSCLWPMLLVPGCLAEPSFLSKKYLMVEGEIVVRDISYYRDQKRDDTITIDIVGGMLSAQQVRANILIVQAPVVDEVAQQTDVDGLSFTLRFSADKQSVLLRLSKKLTADSVCGVYVKQPSGRFLLTATFAAKPDAPHLLRHDVGEGEYPLVSDRRTKFGFHFAKPLSMDSFVLTLKERGCQQQIAFERVVLSADQKTLTITLNNNAQNGLKPGHFYDFFIDEIGASPGHDAQSRPIAQFQAVKESTTFIAWQKPHVRASESTAELVLHYNKPFDASWYVIQARESLAGAHDCIHAVDNATSTMLEQESLPRNMVRLMAKGLKTQTLYHYGARIINQDGQVTFEHGDFMTAEHHPLRIASVMVNPKVKKHEREQDFEYVEIANIDSKNIIVKNLSLRMENIYTNNSVDCPIVVPSSPLELKGGEHFLVVGQGFKDLSRPGVKLVYLEKPTLCGGLANTAPRIITIHDGRGGYVDRYGGHLWRSPEGYSIQRKNLEGLDEANNYCYLPSAERAPGPVVGLCGT